MTYLMEYLVKKTRMLRHRHNVLCVAVLVNLKDGIRRGAKKQQRVRVLTVEQEKEENIHKIFGLCVFDLTDEDVGERRSQHFFSLLKILRPILFTGIFEADISEILRNTQSAGIRNTVVGPTLSPQYLIHIEY